MTAIRCALHVHSTWSDGEFTLEDLRRTFLQDEVRVVLMSDHDTAFSSDAEVSAYQAACAAVSDDRILFIAGLEFTAPDRMHIVGFGACALAPDPDPQAIFRHIHNQAGFSVLAHPRDAHFELIAAMESLPDGLEVWNSKYDGQHGPRARTFALHQSLVTRRSDVRAVCGLDLHWTTQSRALITEVEVASVDRATILAALHAGSFCGVSGPIRVPSDGRMDPALLDRLDGQNRRASRAYGALKAAKRLLGPLAHLVPPGVKRHLRRYF